MTFSIAGRCARTGMLGAGVTTSSMAVGSRCAWAEIGDERSQRFRSPRIGYDNLMTGVDEVTPESLGQRSGAYEADSHDGVPLRTWRRPVLSRGDG